MTRRRLSVMLILAIIVLVLLWPSLSTMLTDWWWFEEVGYQVVFSRELLTRIMLFSVVAIGTAAAIYTNLRLATRGVLPQIYSVQVGPNAVPIKLARITRFIAVPVTSALALLFGLGASAAWDTILLAWYRSPFGSTDPVFGRDVSYYVFLMPALNGLFATLFLLNFLVIVMVAVIYRLRGDLVLTPPMHLHIRPATSQHLGVLIAILFSLIALTLWFVDIPSLVYASHALMVGANYTDLHVVLPALRVSAFAAVASAVVVFLGGQRGKLGRATVFATLGYVVISMLGRGIIPGAVQKFFVSPTELTREAPYLTSHILATRTAWGLDSVETRDLEDAGDLSLADIRNNGPTIDNVRLWDREPLLQTFGQLQEIRTYYDFLSVDDDRYWIDGKYRQVLLSPRELQINSLPPQARNFINEHLTFTHGMGLTLGPVNQVTTEGLPVLFIKDLPPASNVSLKVTRPQIYYGEINYNYAVVGTKVKEFDHPAAGGDVTTEYSGSGGVRVGSLLRRAMLATRFSASNLLFSTDISSDSRVLYYRSITSRAQKALPFMRFDRDPYMVVAEDGTLKWILDGYTTAGTYPYSQRVGGGVNYLRNSLKVVIDAYDGSVTAYLSAPNDPIIQTWAKIFPGIFQPLDSLTPDLRAHLRYPDELFTAQTQLYATYHLDSAAEFYNREDQWQVPVVENLDGSVPFMRHIVMRLPGEAAAEFVYMVPFTPRGRDNLAAWMVARNDGANYGHLRVYTLSRQTLAFGPTQIEGRISQNTEISQQISLWDQRGSKVLRGDLLVIPIERSLVYVQPIYLQAEAGRIPELKRVVVAYQNKVVMDETLDGALSRVFGGSATAAAAPTSTEQANPSNVTTGIDANLLAEAKRHYQQALESQRSGDWARYGEEIKALGAVLSRLGGGNQ